MWSVGKGRLEAMEREFITKTAPSILGPIPAAKPTRVVLGNAVVFPKLTNREREEGDSENEEEYRKRERDYQVSQLSRKGAVNAHQVGPQKVTRRVA